MNQCWFPLREASLSGEAEISRDLDELFSREFDVGEPEARVSQSKRDGGMGRIWIVQGPWEGVRKEVSWLLKRLLLKALVHRLMTSR